MLVPRQNSYVNRFQWVMGTVLFVLIETIAVGMVIKRHEMHIESLAVYLLPILVSLPWVAGVQSYIKIKRRLLAMGSDQGLLSILSYSFAILVVFAYVGTLAGISLLLSALHAAGAH
jgi:hypothetical protein